MNERIAVIGGGIVGAAIAWRLAAEGAPVRLLDAGVTGASHQSIGWINAAWGNAPDYLRLRLNAIAAWQVLTLPELGLRWTGTLSWEADDPAAHAERHAAIGQPIRVVYRAGIAELEPDLAELPEAAVRCAEEGVADATLAAAAFHRAAVEAGAEIETVRVVPDGAGYRREGGARLDEPAVVVAAGCGTPALTGIPIRTVPGLVAQTAPVPAPPAHVLVAPDIMVTPLPDGALLLGGGAGGSRPTETPAAASAALVSRAAALLGQPVQLDHWWVGQRPVPQDGLPVVGPVPERPGVYAAVMHSGVTLAPLVGRLVAGELLSGRADPLLAPYRPERITAPAA